MTTFALPIDEENQFVGLLGADITLQFINGYMQPLDGPFGKMLIVTDKGKVLASSTHRDIEGEKIKFLKIFSLVLWNTMLLIYSIRFFLPVPKRMDISYTVIILNPLHGNYFIS